jgi:TonB family protein
MKYLLVILTFSLFSIVTFAQTDTTEIDTKPKTKRDYEFGKKPAPKPRPKPKFGWNAGLINLDDLSVSERDSIFYVEGKPYVRTDNRLFEVNMSDKIYQIVDEMPMFPACDSLTKYEERQSCAAKAMLDFIYSNLKYTPISREGGVEGTAVISFIVEKDGTITNAKIIRDPGAGCGTEGLRLVNLFPNFEPGKIDGKPVRFEWNLPIKFRLE